MYRIGFVLYYFFYNLFIWGRGFAKLLFYKPAIWGVKNRCWDRDKVRVSPTPTPTPPPPHTHTHTPSHNNRGLNKLRKLIVLTRIFNTDEYRIIFSQPFQDLKNILQRSAIYIMCRKMHKIFIDLDLPKDIHFSENSPKYRNSKKIDPMNIHAKIPYSRQVSDCGTSCQKS